MKRQIRRGTFETNSSSIHSLTMCNQDEYDKFERGELYIERWGSSLKTKEQLIEKFKTVKDWRSGNLKYPNTNWDDDEIFMKIMRENDYCTSEEYWDTVSEECETFEDSYTTPNGDKVVAFGYYGYN